mmetsp:Transcript_41309/g.119535  ORF Transcript_41309/g.119535 Transcript_41309/m.119535 type:complete len:280 (+) Transcript_41309:429-1268(+)
MSSRDFPFVSGQKQSTKISPVILRSNRTAKTPPKPMSGKTTGRTRSWMVTQVRAALRPRAHPFPRMWFSKTSGMYTQGTGPTPTENPITNTQKPTTCHATAPCSSDPPAPIAEATMQRQRLSSRSGRRPQRSKMTRATTNITEIFTTPSSMVTFMATSLRIPVSTSSDVVITFSITTPVQTLRTPTPMPATAERLWLPQNAFSASPQLAKPRSSCSAQFLTARSTSFSSSTSSASTAFASSVRPAFWRKRGDSGMPLRLAGNSSMMKAKAAGIAPAPIM